MAFERSRAGQRRRGNGSCRFAPRPACISPRSDVALDPRVRRRLGRTCRRRHVFGQEPQLVDVLHRPAGGDRRSGARRGAEGLRDLRRELHGRAGASRIFGVYGATLDGNGAGSTLTISSGDVKVFGLRITNGTGTDPCSPDGCVVGGGIYNHGALTLVRSSVDGNSASNLGAGIFYDAERRPDRRVPREREHGEFLRRRYPQSRNRGHLAVDGRREHRSGRRRDRQQRQPDDHAFRGPHNVATDLFGGAIINNATLTINRSTLSGNSAPASGGYGGAITNQIGTVSITDSVVSGNSAAALGGGIMGQTDGAVILTRSSISENSAPSGGGSSRAVGASPSPPPRSPGTPRATGAACTRARPRRSP